VLAELDALLTALYVLIDDFLPARERLGHLFRHIPGQPAYNRRLRRLAPAICQVIGHLARDSPSFCDRLRLLDSTPVPCGASRETVKRSELAGVAAGLLERDTARPRDLAERAGQHPERGL
jgi:hypothetical protein